MYNSKEKRNKWAKEYYKKHPEEMRERVKRYRKKYPEKVKESKNKYRREHPEIERKYRTKYRNKHRDKARSYARKYRREHVEVGRARVNLWQKTHPEWISEYGRKRRKIPKWNINSKMNTAIGKALKNNKAGRRWENLVGYTVVDLRKHLEKLFTSGMDFEKLMNGEIHIDHIIPKSLFEYEGSEDREFKQCWALANLQPLWARDNMIKHNNFIGIPWREPEDRP